MAKTEVVNKGGVGICGWMFLIFLTLKLIGYIAWSWWWVTAPLWAPFVIILAALAIFVLVGIVVKLIDRQ